MDIAITGQSDGRRFQRVFDGTGYDLHDEEYLVVAQAFGAFSVYLRAETAQYVDVSVTFNQVHISNSPSLAQIQPNVIDVTNCVFLNNRPIGGEVGIVHVLTVQARDAYSNHITEGGQRFRARMDMAEAITDPGSGDNPLFAQASVSTPGIADDYYHRGAL
eukprot:1182727-Prorocentrum_minimum.AAC.5